MSKSFRIIPCDLDQPDHQRAVIQMIDAYSRDPMGDGKPLAEDVKQRLIPGLQAHPTTIIFLAFDVNTPIGIALCFRGFSSFYAKPLINIHDIAVVESHRGRGIGRHLLQAVIDKGHELGCCKLTLETQERNFTAQKLYKGMGFARDVHMADAGGAIFMTRPL